MFRTKAVVGVLFVVSVASISNAANIIYVDVNGPNDPGTGSYEDPFRRIQDAIDLADNNDTVIVAEGVYTGDPNNRDLHLDGKTITIRSTDPNDPNVVANTIIDPNGVGRGFNFHSGEDTNCVVAGFTLQNGATDDGSGGAIYCSDSSPTIRNCVIIKNTAYWMGGGIYFFNSESTIRNCIIAGNSVLATGGGVKCVSCSNLAIINCTISGNSAEWQQGEGIFCFNSTVSINNSIIWGNGLEQIHTTDGDATVTYSDVQNGWPGTGNNNIDADPCFAEPGYWADANDPNIVVEPNDPNAVWIDGDYHLLPDSPCIDAGDPNSDWSNEPWPNGKRVNMGAYGGTNQASMNGNPADFDIDGVVDFVDFAEFSNKWFTKETCVEDLTNNGVVDFADLGMFAENWLWQRE